MLALTARKMTEGRLLLERQDVRPSSSFARIISIHSSCHRVNVCPDTPPEVLARCAMLQGAGELFPDIAERAVKDSEKGDTWGFGMLLYELMDRRRPYTDIQTATEVSQKILTHQVGILWCFLQSRALL